MAPPAGQRSINAFFKAPAIATSVVRKPARADPPETEEAETESVPGADDVAEEASRGGADWHLGGERRPVATYGRRRRGDARRAGAALSKDDAGADDAPSTSARSDPVDAKRARSEVATTLRDGSSRANSRAAAPGMKQLFLDLGQKNFGHRKCPECGLLYAVGEPEDERTHAKFHAEATGRAAGSSAGQPSRGPGQSPNRIMGVPCPKTWRDAAAWTCANDPSGRFVAHIGPDDHRARWGKAIALAEHVGDELGAERGWVLGEDAERRGTAAFVYVLKDRIVGALFAEPLRRAYRTIPDDGGETGPGESSGGESPAKKTTGSRPVTHYGGKVLRRRANPTRAVMGIRAAWVHPAHRRRGIATSLLRVARERLVPGYSCDASETAWTQPTEDGAALAAATCGLGDGTFLVY